MTITHELPILERLVKIYIVKNQTIVTINVQPLFVFRTQVKYEVNTNTRKVNSVIEFILFYFNLIKC